MSFVNPEVQTVVAEDASGKAITLIVCRLISGHRQSTDEVRQASIKVLFGRAIRSLREERGYSREELEERAVYSPDQHGMPPKSYEGDRSASAFLSR